MTEQHRPKADQDSLQRIFTVPEAPTSTLSRIEKQVSENLERFLQQHIVSVEQDLVDIEKDFADAAIPENPVYVSEQAEFLLDKLVSQSVHTSSPSFIGHMTSALPYFMLPLSKIMMALNQNLVKIETSKAFTPLERQVLGMIHRLVFANDGDFYEQRMHDPKHALGAVCSGGTVANITALWVARNNCLGADGKFQGVMQEGLYRAFKHYDCEGVSILMSRRGHYSLGKAADILGVGRDAVIEIETNAEDKVDPEAVYQCALRGIEQGIKPMAIVGVAGSSETGSVDPLNELADVAETLGCHFHVDAAWGGPTLFSQRYRHLLKGIERADSVTIDAHKQMYVPMGIGFVVFKSGETLSKIEHHAEYIIRKGSKDLGSHTLEGSRPGMAMLVHSGFRIMGRAGYELLINLGIEKARTFADMIDSSDDFELVSKPELNILTYRYLPKSLQEAIRALTDDVQDAANHIINRITKRIQKLQRARGKSFVSRTRLNPVQYGQQPVVVFRVVLANPMTTTNILQDILDEQRQLSQDDSLAGLWAELQSLIKPLETALP